MKKSLEKAFDEASKLAQDEQESLGRWLLAELAAQRRWDELLDDSQGALANLADEVITEHRAGKSRPLEPDEL